MSYTTKISAIATAAAIAFVGTQALAANSTSGTASATIASPISITETTQLSFGSVTAGTTAGTVVVAPAGGATYGGGVTNFGGGAAPAAFSVTGSVNTAFSVTVDPSATLSNGVNSMTVDTFATNLTNGAGTLSATGTAVVNVGATLNVSANQPAGAYTGTYNVTVNY